MKLVFDTETTGLPETKGFDNFYPPAHTKYYENSRLIELAYAIVDDNFSVVKKVSNLIAPNYFIINNSHIHGITNEMAEKGVSIEEALYKFEKDILKYSVNTLIAHNANFDLHIILSEAYRIKMDNSRQYEPDSLISLLTLKDNIKIECTMKMSHSLIVSTIPENIHPFINFVKSPKLVELHKFLFNEEVKQEHRAMSDVEICLKCYYRLVTL